MKPLRSFLNLLFRPKFGKITLAYVYTFLPSVLILNLLYLAVDPPNLIRLINKPFPGYLVLFDIIFIPVFVLLFVKYMNTKSVLREKRESAEIQSRYKSLIDSMNYLIVRVNAEGEFTFANKAYCKKFGKDCRELLGSNFRNFVLQSDLLTISEEMEKLKLPPYRRRFEHRARTVDGLRWIEWEENIIRDDMNNITEIQAIGRDITERKNYETKLLLSEMAIQRTPNGVVITDPAQNDNPIIFCNPAYEKMTGFKAEEVIGKNPRILQGERTDKITVEKIRKALKKEEECDVTILNYKKDGTPFWNEIRVIPVHDGTGKLLNFLGIKKDISDRFDNERIIKESETKFRSIVEQSIDGIMLIDESGIIVEWNNALERITGLSKMNTIGKSLTDIDFNPKPGGVFSGRKYGLIDIVQEIIEKKGTKNFNKPFEDELSKKDGSIISLQSIVYPIITDKGIMIGSVIRDITEKKKIEKQNMVFNRAIESSASGVVIFDLNYNVQYVNKSLVKILGASDPNDILGKIGLKFAGDDENNITKNLNDFRQKGEWLGEIKIKCVNGGLLDAELNSSFVRDEQGNPIYILGIITDITARKESEDALKNSEQRYRFVVDNIKEVIFQTDAEGNWLFLNHAWEETTGFSVKDSIGKQFLNYVHPEDREKNNKEFGKLICFEKEYCRHVVRYLTKNGNFKWIEVFARLTFDEKGMINGTSGSLYDITEKVLAEEEMKENLKKERELSELKSRFVSTVSHEFRTPLTSILASAELILRYNNKWSDDKKITTIQRIQNSALFMNEMVGGVLDLNRAESGRVVYSPKQLELIQFLREVFDEAIPLAGEKHNLVFSSGEEKLNGFFDEKMLRSVIINLLSNAIKYSPGGGKIELKIEREGNFTDIYVSDNGMGIPEEDKNNLFLPFFRAKNIGNISGTGLGLSIVKKSLELQNGKITFSSETGKGTTFKVTLPIKNQ